MSRATLLASVLLLTSWGCEIPTELPEWSTEWSFAFTADTLRTAHFLPDGVTEDGGEFVWEPISATQTVTVEEVCELCACFDGPVPPLPLGPMDWSLPVPGGVVSSEISRGEAEVAIRNDLAFDLLDDGEGNRGWLRLALVNAVTGEVMDSARFDESLPPGDSAIFRFDLAGLRMDRNARARIEGFTPGSGCDTVDLDPTTGIRSELRVRDVRASSVEIVVSESSFALDPRKIELPELISDRLRPGEARGIFEIEVENRMATSLDLALSTAADAGALFGREAALHTPFPIPAGGRLDPARNRERFLVDLSSLEGAAAVHVAGRPRIVGGRKVEIRGGEGVIYRTFFRAEVPSR